MIRWLNPKNAAAYLGTNINLFNKDIRPHLVEIPIGERGIRFDKLDLDAFADQYKTRYGRSGDKTCLEKEC